MKPTFGSLFAGIGGIDLGLERAGWECAFQVEIDSYAQKILEKHWPNIRRWSDIRSFPSEPVESWKCDMLAGGFPCQPVSLAGRGLGNQDDRWLWPEFARCIRVLRPRFALLENVPGLLVRGMGSVLGDLAEVGYDAEWCCLSASAVGAPHLRDRVFILAYTYGELGETRPAVFSELDWERPLLRGIDTKCVQIWKDAIPKPCGNTDGVPSRLDRVRCLGNAVVPQVAEWIGKKLLPFVREEKSGTEVR